MLDGLCWALKIRTLYSFDKMDRESAVATLAPADSAGYQGRTHGGLGGCSPPLGRINREQFFKAKPKNTRKRRFSPLRLPARAVPSPKVHDSSGAALASRPVRPSPILASRPLVATGPAAALRASAVAGRLRSSACPLLSPPTGVRPPRLLLWWRRRLQAIASAQPPSEQRPGRQAAPLCTLLSLWCDCLSVSSLEVSFSIPRSSDSDIQ